MLFPYLLLSAAAASPVAHPGLDFGLLGSQIGIFGEYSGISFYDYTNQSSFLSADGSQGLYLRNISTSQSAKVATVEGGAITQLQQLSLDTVLVLGDFTAFNDESALAPLIYNVTSGSVTLLFSQTSKRDDSLSGTVKTSLVDRDLIYLGGDFEFNNTYGAAVYNITSKSMTSFPFKGFGENASVNAIVKYGSGDDSSLIFGGSFDTLGLPELLEKNVTSPLNHTNLTNSTQTSLILAEQVISLKHATFSSNGGDYSNDNSALTCPGTLTWSTLQNSGGEWIAHLPQEMRGLTPTKVRIYLPEGSDGTQQFRLYTYPNNGIMNLTYVDPSTNELAHCDAWCSLERASTLQNITLLNLEEKNSTHEESESVFIDDSGSFAMYYDSSTNSKNLGYGSNYQEFALVNLLQIDGIGLTTISWYGNKGGISGVELFSNAISVYGNETLNEPNCGTESVLNLNSAEEKSGNWSSVQSLSPVTDVDYLVGTGSDAEITLYPNISYSGNYSLLFYTPGCSLDGSCSKRSLVNVTLSDMHDTVLESKLIYQNNLDDKFDYLFYGHLNGSSEANGRNKVTIANSVPIEEGISDPWTVVDRVVANIVSLDEYFATNSTNSTKSTNSSSTSMERIYLNGLFEYSLANFLSFEESLVYSELGNQTVIDKSNTFVGNSSINELSGRLQSGSITQQIILQNNSDSSSAVLLGQFSSNNITLPNESLLTLTLEGYNSSLNSTEASLSRNKLKKREEQDIDGVTFNQSITALQSTDNGYVALGKFSVSVNGSTSIFNLADSNRTVSSAANFLLSSGGSWFSFGNSYIDSDFSQLATFTIDATEYYVFSSDTEYKVWDNSDRKWAEENFDITAAVLLTESNQQLLAGSSFGEMNFTSNGAVFIQNNTQFNDYGLNVSNGVISNSFFINETVSVIGGSFEANGSINNLAFITNEQATPVDSDIEWSNSSAVTSLFVDGDGQYLFVGTNGSAKLASSDVTGLFVYDLKNRTLASSQPASLSSSDNKVAVNALVYYDTAKQLLVGGHFESAGSLGCESVCIYDVGATRWISPEVTDSQLLLTGDVTDGKFLSSESVLLSGNLTINGTEQRFVVYDFKLGTYNSAGSRLNNVGVNGVIRKFSINQASDGNLDNRMSAFGENFVIGFNGSSWSRIDDAIEFSNATILADMKLLPLSKRSSSSAQEYFDSDYVLMLAGKFNLTGFGVVNAALYDGLNWSPYLFTENNLTAGVIHNLLLEDLYRYQSSADIKKGNKNLSVGKVVGISLACAIGTTALIGALFLVPMFLLFKEKSGHQKVDQRIHEDDMMNVVNPEDLLHEIDLHRYN